MSHQQSPEISQAEMKQLKNVAKAAGLDWNMFKQLFHDHGVKAYTDGKSGKITGFQYLGIDDKLHKVGIPTSTLRELSGKAGEQQGSHQLRHKLLTATNDSTDTVSLNVRVLGNRRKPHSGGQAMRGIHSGVVRSKLWQLFGGKRNP